MRLVRTVEQGVLNFRATRLLCKGTIPPDLEDGEEEEPRVVEWRAWVLKSRADREEQLQQDIQEDSVAEWEGYLTMDLSHLE